MATGTWREDAGEHDRQLEGHAQRQPEHGVEDRAVGAAQRGHDAGHRHAVQGARGTVADPRPRSQGLPGAFPGPLPARRPVARPGAPPGALLGLSGAPGPPNKSGAPGPPNKSGACTAPGGPWGPRGGGMGAPWGP